MTSPLDSAKERLRAGFRYPAQTRIDQSQHFEDIRTVLAELERLQAESARRLQIVKTQASVISFLRNNPEQP